MNTRREISMALLGLPLLAGPARAQSGQEPKPQPRPVPQPYSEAAASIISYTLYAEARGEKIEGKRAVASVIHTRARLARTSPAAVCLQDRQFSCWNDLKEVPDNYVAGTGLRHKDLLARSQCFAIAWILMVSSDEWDYLTHFYNPDKATPDWAYELKGVRTIGNHVFGYIDRWTFTPSR